MEITLRKIASAVIAAGYVIAIAILSIVRGVKVDSVLVMGLIGLSVILCLPLALIWFPDQIATAIGAADEVDTGKYFDFPEMLVSFAGWLILFGAPVAVVLYLI